MKKTQMFVAQMLGFLLVFIGIGGLEGGRVWLCVVCMAAGCLLLHALDKEQEREAERRKNRRAERRAAAGAGKAA